MGTFPALSPAPWSRLGRIARRTLVSLLGALLVAIARVGIPLLELTPASVKSSVAGHGGADKQQVARMVKLQLGLGAIALPSDASDALALALAAGQSAAAQRLGMR